MYRALLLSILVAVILSAVAVMTGLTDPVPPDIVPPNPAAPVPDGPAAVRDAVDRIFLNLKSPDRLNPVLEEVRRYPEDIKNRIVAEIRREGSAEARKAADAISHGKKPGP